MTLKGRTAVVTGASSGIGRAVALELARRGANLVLGARRLELLEPVAAQCSAMGVSARAVVTDVTRREDCIRLIQSAPAVDVLINNAGFAIFDAVADADVNVFTEMMQTNFFGAVHCTQAALPQMLARKSGSIVNISSIAGLMGYARMSGYCASKFAVAGFTEALRSEVMSSGVRVALVCPGTVKTDFFVKAEWAKIPMASRLVPGISAESVAGTICNAAESGTYRKIVPAAAALYMRFKEFSPRFAHALLRGVSRVLESR
jgi:short-subunit dehydrogenase